ncbi:hypothetical protein [Paenibacillus sp. CAA11]
MFAWFLEGLSKNAIVRRLNDSGVLCPSPSVSPGTFLRMGISTVRPR